MREVGIELVEDGDKYCELLPLYNKWHKATYILSTGNTNVPEFEKLVNYCKENKIETLHFFLDLIDAFEESHKNGTRADNCVGHFLCVLDECFPDLYTCDGFCSMKSVQNIYNLFAKQVLSEIKTN